MRSVLFLVVCFLITNYSIGQITFRDVDSTSIIKESDTYDSKFIDSNKSDLEEFSNEDDAVIYVYRMKAMAGAAVKWKIVVSDRAETKLKNGEYFTVHIDTKQKFHYLEFPYIKFNYMNFEPNKYYAIGMKGFSVVASTGYLHKEDWNEISKMSRNKIISVK